MLANSWLLLKVSSQKPQRTLMLASEGFVTDGSTRPGAGFKWNVRGVPMENQMRPPSTCGIVTVVVEPGPLRRIAQFCARGDPVDGGDTGKYSVRPSDCSKKRAWLCCMACPVTKAYTVFEAV